MPVSKTVVIVALILIVAVGVIAYYIASLPSPPTTPTTPVTTPTTPITPTTPTTPTTPVTPPPVRMIIYASLSEMTTADPSTDFSNSVMWLPLVYEPLLWYDPISDKFIPALATNYSSSADGLTWTFTIRRDAKFHDGTPVTAHAVKSSIDRTITLGEGAAFIWDPVESIEAPDDYTVVFHLKYPAALDKVAATTYAAYIFSPKIVEYAGTSDLTDPKVADWFNSGNDAGSGPYKMIKWDPENEVILEKFTEWWGWKLPDYPMKSDKAPDIFKIKVIKDAVTQETLILSGDIDIAMYVPLENIEQHQKNPNLQVLLKPSFQNLLMLVNVKKPPLDNVLVRRAIAHAVPYDDIVTVARNELATVASGPVPRGMWGHFDNLTFTYDLKLARELLAQAGYPSGIGRTLVLTYTAGDIYEARTADLIRASLAQIGINVEIRPLSWEEQWALAQKGWEDPNIAQDFLIFYWWPDVVSPFTFLYNMFHNASKAFNLCYYENAEFNALIEEAVVLEGVDEAKALELYYRAQKILHDDVPGVPLWDMIDLRVAKASIGNLDKAVNPAYPTVVFAQVLSVGG